MPGAESNTLPCPSGDLLNSARRVIGTDLHPNLELASLRHPTISEANPDREYLTASLSTEPGSAILYV
jgi:hypothetical protein